MNCSTCTGALYTFERGICSPCVMVIQDDFAFVWNLGGIYNYRVRAKIKVVPKPPLVGETIRVGTLA